MRKKMYLRVNLIEQKNKAFVYISKKPRVKITEQDVREELLKEGYSFSSLKSFSNQLCIFNIKQETTREEAIRNFNPEELEKTDLTLSYGSSELEEAPEPPTEEKPKPPARRRRTRRKTTKKEE